jgi:hypothetical protein
MLTKSIFTATAAAAIWVLPIKSIRGSLIPFAGEISFGITAKKVGGF